MSQQHIHMTQSYTAPVEAVFAALADHDGLGSILGIPVKRLQAGVDDVNGVGSVRRIGPGPIGTQETVTAFEPGKTIGYRITRFGGPIVNHHGELQFAATADGCTVTWDIHFDTKPAFLGSMLHKVLNGAIGRGLAKLSQRLS
jgi:uncharacterized protein YndB with AHSA1/START domain